jgi:hypothetical protein
VQESLEEKLRAGDCVNRNVEGQCLLDTMSDCVGKVEKRAGKPWITQEIISKNTLTKEMEESIMKKEGKIQKTE